jgi:hypothetical protein
MASQLFVFSACQSNSLAFSSLFFAYQPRGAACHVDWILRVFPLVSRLLCWGAIELLRERVECIHIISIA